MADRPEARIPCPQCGGAIHPVAGKCKHCKADLAALRVGKPQAQAALPKLTPSGPAVVAPPSVVHAAYNPDDPSGVRAAVDRAIARIDPSSARFSAIKGEPPSQQILPPRPTGRMFAAAAPAARWPIIVIAISALAILLSIGALAR